MLRGGEQAKKAQNYPKKYIALILGCSRMLYAMGNRCWKDGNFGYLEFTLVEKRFKMSFSS